MIKRLSTKMIYTVGAFLSIVPFIVFIFVVFHITAVCSERILLLSFLVLFIVIEVAIMWFIRKKIAGFSDRLSLCLEDMINGKEDITFDLNKETLMAKLQIKLRQLYEIMQQHTKQSIEEKKAIQSLVSDISHQVKTPIANIKMYNDILQDRSITADQQQKFLQVISTQINKLDFLMQSMVKMSRMETGVLEVLPRRSLIYNTIAQALSGILPKAELKHINITVKCEETLEVLHDEKWTTEALFNILDNAVKYTPANGIIAISVSRWEFYTKIDISDTGKGISEKSHAAIFKRFYREPDVHNQDGVGIGLYLAREIITMQNGYIEVKSELEHGATFSVFIPN